MLLLKHSPHKFENFEEEVQYIINHERRNKFIRNLALDLKGNTLVLFQRVEGHGQPLYDLINSSIEDHVFFVHGGVATEDREKVREITEQENNAIIVAYMERFLLVSISRISIMSFLLLLPSLEYGISNLLEGYLEKEITRRRQHSYDIADDISYKSRKNYTLNHLIERIKVYNEENFNYDIVNIPLKN